MNAQAASSIAMWLPIDVKLQHWAGASRRLRHCTSMQRRRGPDDFVEHGETTWAMNSTLGTMTILFEWAEVTRGVLALANPMGIVSNVRLMTDEGDLLTPAQTLLELNFTVHELDWQTVVASKIESWRDAAAPSSSSRASREKASIGRRAVGGRTSAALAFSMAGA